MEFQVKVLLITFFVTVAISIVVIPLLRKLKVGQIERDDGPESHLKKQGTPTMGGIILMFATIVSSVIVYIYYLKIRADVEVAKQLLPLIITAFGFGLIGFIDDFKKLVLKNTKGLNPKAKMFGLLLVSVCFVVFLLKGIGFGTEMYIPFLKQYITLPIFVYIPFIILVMLSTTNAINLTDGIDGLSSSVTAIILTALTIISIVFNVKEVTVFGSTLIGACLGFLLFNLYPSKVMMGDTGSLMLGGAVSAIAIYLKMPLILLILALIPIIETLSVMIQVMHYKRTGNRIFKMAPLHHHFELSGWKENKVVSIFSLVTIIVCVIGLFAV